MEMLTAVCTLKAGKIREGAKSGGWGGPPQGTGLGLLDVVSGALELWTLPAAPGLTTVKRTPRGGHREDKAAGPQPGGGQDQARSERKEPVPLLGATQTWIAP